MIDKSLLGVYMYVSNVLSTEMNVCRMLVFITSNVFFKWWIILQIQHDLLTYDISKLKKNSLN